VHLHSTCTQMHTAPQLRRTRHSPARALTTERAHIHLISRHPRKRGTHTHVGHSSTRPHTRPPRDVMGGQQSRHPCGNFTTAAAPQTPCSSAIARCHCVRPSTWRAAAAAALPVFHAAGASQCSDERPAPPLSIHQSKAFVSLQSVSQSAQSAQTWPPPGRTHDDSPVAELEK